MNLLDRVKSGPVNEGMYRYFIRTKKFRVTDQCIHCGVCAEVCPLANIRLENGTPRWGGRCTHCISPAAPGRPLNTVRPPGARCDTAARMIRPEKEKRSHAV